MHAWCDTCHPAPDTLQIRTVCLPDNEDITLTSTMKSRDERVTTKDAAPNSNSLLRDAIACAGVLGRLYGFWVPCSGPVSTPNGKFPEGHSRTRGTYGAQWSTSKLFR